jgi:hypothetical protein
MPSKLVGYSLLSFLSFCFFTIVFNAIAIVQVSAQQPTTTPNPGNVVPTPTIYNAQPEKALPQKELTVIVSTPTPTVAQIHQVLTSSTQKSTQQQISVTPVPPTDTPTPTVLPTVTPTPSPEQTMSTTTDLETLFGKYSSQYSVSEDELKKIANCESGFNSASDTGLYAGMYQFSATTWASVRGLMGLDGNADLRKNAEEAIKTAAFMLSRGEQNAWPNCH